MVMEQEMDDVREKVIRLEGRVDRHGEALGKLEQAGTRAENRIAELSDTARLFLSNARLIVWIAGIMLVASQTGLLGALKLALGL